MNTTLKNRIEATSNAIQTQGQKAFKHPITSILSLCLVAGIAATIAGFSQAPTGPAVDTAVPTAATPETPATAPATTGVTLPTPRTLTSADGRTIDVTILSKSPTAIKAARADGKEFEITLDKLSDADRDFVTGLVDAPVKKPTLLFIGYNQEGITINETVIETLKTAGFEVSVHLSVPPKISTEHSTWPGIDAMTDEQIKVYEVIWEERGPHKRLLNLLTSYEGVMVMKSNNHARLKEFLADDIGSYYDVKPHVKVDKNLIRYQHHFIEWVGSNGSRKDWPIQPEFIEQAIAEVKKQLKNSTQK